jgi:hypothetical protein
MELSAGRATHHRILPRLHLLHRIPPAFCTAESFAMAPYCNRSAWNIHCGCVLFVNVSICETVLEEQEEDVEANGFSR